MKESPLIEWVMGAIDDLKGVDVVALDVRAQTPMTDAMVICTGTSNRHVRSIAENVIREAKHRGHPPRGVEGLNAAEWVLVDLGEALVHVMQAHARVFYQLEKLWDMGVDLAPSAAGEATPQRAGKRKKATRKPAPRKTARRKARKKPAARK